MINNHWLKKYCTAKHRLGTVICLMLFAVLSGGCINSDAGFIDIPPATQSKYELPVKFYPDQIKMVYCQNQVSQERFLDENQIPVIRQGLCRHFPELFADKADNALPLNIEIINRNLQSRMNPLQNMAHAFSSLTLLLIPAKIEYSCSVEIKISVNDMTRSRNLELIRSMRQGLFNMQQAFDPPTNTWFSSSGFNWNPLYAAITIRDEHQKDFLQLIVNEVCALPADKIHKLYMKNSSKYSELLE